MPYRLPHFNLAINGWRNGSDTTGPADYTFMGGMNLGRRVVTGPDADLDVGIDSGFRYLMCPKGTPIRSQFSTGAFDTVEVPAGSGFFYLVIDAERCGLGFPNEYVRAMCSPIVPMPDFS